MLENERPLEQYPPAEGRTNTGEWVRFTMRRIEALRALNDPAYAPRPMNRLRTEEVARRQRAADKAREEAEAAEEEAREAARAAKRAAKEAARQARLKREAEEAEAAGPAAQGGKDAAGGAKPPAGAGKGLVAAKKEPGTGGAGRDGRNGDQPAAKKIKLEGKQPGSGLGPKKAGAGGAGGSGKDGAAALPSGASRKRPSAVNGSNKAGRAGSGGLQSQSSQQLLTLLQTAGRPQQRAQEQQPQPKAEPGSGSGGVGACAAGVKEEPGQASGHGNGVQVVVKFQPPTSAPGSVGAPGATAAAPGGSSSSGGGSGSSDCYSQGNTNGCTGPSGVEHVVMLAKRGNDDLAAHVGLSASGSASGAGTSAEAKLLPIKRESSVDGSTLMGLGGGGGGGAYKRSSAEQALPSAARLVMNEQRLQLHELRQLQHEQHMLQEQLQKLHAQRRNADDRLMQMHDHLHQHQHDANGQQQAHHGHSRVFDVHTNETTGLSKHPHQPQPHPQPHLQPHPAASAAGAVAPALDLSAPGLPCTNLLGLHVQEHQQLLMQVERAGNGTSGGAPAGRGVLDTLRVMSGGSTASQLGNSATAGAVAPAALRSSHSASAAGSGLLGSLGLGREDAQTLLRRVSNTAQGGDVGGGGGTGGDYLDMMLQRRRQLQLQQQQQQQQQYQQQQQSQRLQGCEQMLGLHDQGSALGGSGLAGGLGGRERGLGGLLGGGAEASLYADRQAPLQQHQQHQHLRLPGAGSPRGSLGSALLGGAGAHRQAGIAAEGLRLPFPA